MTNSSKDNDSTSDKKQNIKKSNLLLFLNKEEPKYYRNSLNLNILKSDFFTSYDNTPVDEQKVNLTRLSILS
jgi:hypothetical protein